MGFEMERRLFGGHVSIMFDDQIYHHYNDGVDWRQSAFAGIPVVWRYPYRGLINSYREFDSYIGVRETKRLCFDQIPPYDLAWRVPFSWIAKFLQTAFWTRVANLNANDYAGALQAPRTLGYFFFREAQDNITPQIPDMEHWPAGFDMSNKGDILPLAEGARRRKQKPRVPVRGGRRRR